MDIQRSLDIFKKHYPDAVIRGYWTLEDRVVIAATDPATRGLCGSSPMFEIRGDSVYRWSNPEYMEFALSLNIQDNDIFTHPNYHKL